MNLVRGYLLVDKPSEAGTALHAGKPGDEIAALVLAPALAARIALRHGRLCEAERQATAAPQAAHAFGLDNHGARLMPILRWREFSSTATARGRDRGVRAPA
jgi:hypothetical protein